MKTTYPVPSTVTVPLSPCGEVIRGEDCGHGTGCSPPRVTPPANPTTIQFALIGGRLRRVEATP